MKRLECLDGLRGMLAVYVMLGHLAPFAVLPAWLQVAVSHGGAAVDVFFMLSGLVIMQSLGRPGSFLLARAARIMPVFLPVFAFAVLLEPLSCGYERMGWIGPDNAARTICVSNWPRTWAPEIAAHLTMTNGVFPDGLLPYAWVSFLGAAWSLSTEWQFYVVALLAHRTGPTRLAWGLLLLAVGGLAWDCTVPEVWRFSRAFLPNEAHFFALGVASLGVVQGRRGGAAVYGLALAATLAICARHETFGKLLPPILWTLLLAVQMRPWVAGLRWIAVALRCRVAQSLGAISYCVYLVNEPVHKLLAAGVSWVARGDAVLFTAVWLPVAIGVPLVVSAWLHVHLEVPGVRWGRAMADRLLLRRVRRGR